MKTKLLKVIFLVVVACIVLSLFFVEIKPLLVRCNLLNILNQNLAFIAKQIEKFGSLIIISLLVFVIIYFKSKFTLEISSFSIGNININIKNIDRVVISNIRNYLNSKRTLFLIDILSRFLTKKKSLPQWKKSARIPRMWRKQKENGATQTGYTVSYIELSFRTPLICDSLSVILRGVFSGVCHSDGTALRSVCHPALQNEVL